MNNMLLVTWEIQYSRQVISSLLLIGNPYAAHNTKGMGHHPSRSLYWVVVRQFGEGIDSEHSKLLALFGITCEFTISSIQKLGLIFHSSTNNNHRKNVGCTTMDQFNILKEDDIV